MLEIYIVAVELMYSKYVYDMYNGIVIYLFYNLHLFLKDEVLRVINQWSFGRKNQ